MARRAGKTGGRVEGSSPDAALRLMMDVAVASNEARSVEEALQIAIDRVCVLTGWPVGHCYMVDNASRTLTPTEIWHLDDPERFTSFVAVTKDTTLKFGEGLPGRTLDDGKPAWVIDVTKDANSTRARSAADIGVRAGFAFPVVTGSEVAAVLEFFAPAAAPPDEALLDVMSHVGTQLGRVIERTRSEEALRVSEDAYRRIMETANDAFVSIDIDGRIVDWNKQAELTFGWARHEVLGRPLAETIIPLRFREAHKRGLHHFLETGEGPVIGKRVELAALHRDEHEFPIELTVWVLNVGSTFRFNAFVHDITERKKAEWSLRESEQRFAEAYRRERDAAERLRTADEMKNAFMSAVSHELRTPLTTVLGFARMLDERRDELPRAQQDDFVARIALNAAKLDKLLADLLDLDRLSRGIAEPKRTPTDMLALIERIAGPFQAFEDGKLIVEGERLVADVDATKVERIVDNLIANAAKYAPASKVWVRVERVAEGVCIVVEDEGPGIPDDLKRTIFEPFVRAALGSEHAPGTGIGLALVARFAELHAGRAWVEDRPGGGASFKVWLRAAVRD